jgi:hypothetical protein
MELVFASGYEISMEACCSLEQAQRAIARDLRSPAAPGLSSGTAVGLIERNQFWLHFRKPGRNFWRPEFKGSFSTTDNHVKIVVSCGLSKEAEIATSLYWILLVFVSICLLGKLIAGPVNRHDFLLSCSVVAFSFVLPCVSFWKEFRYDKIRMKSILDDIDRGDHLSREE